MLLPCNCQIPQSPLTRHMLFYCLQTAVGADCCTVVFAARAAVSASLEQWLCVMGCIPPLLWALDCLKPSASKAAASSVLCQNVCPRNLCLVRASLSHTWAALANAQLLLQGHCRLLSPPSIPQWRFGLLRAEQHTEEHSVLRILCTKRVRLLFPIDLLSQCCDVQ